MSEYRGLAVEDVVNLNRYPVEDPDNPQRRELVRHCRETLDAQQFCVLPEFVSPAALDCMVGEVEQLLDRAYRNRSRRNCYLERDPFPSLPLDHPRNLQFDASYRMIASDLIAGSSPLKKLYYWEPVQRLLADIVGVSKLYPNEDPYQPVNVNCCGQGDCSTWHFDSSNAFTVTLMLQTPEGGGEFELSPNTRTQDDENYDQVRSVLLGDRSQVLSIPREPGAMVVFRGCNSLHRVTPVQGDRVRMMAVFVYETEPGVTGDAVVNETVYGPRTRPAETHVHQHNL
jgi:hypothetical protein